MASLPNGRTSPGPSIFSVLERHIKERESEILSEPTPNEIELMEPDENEIAPDNVTDLVAELGKTENSPSALADDSDANEDEFVRDSSDNESVITEEDESDSEDSDSKAQSLKTKGDEKVKVGLWKDAIDYYTEALQCRQMAVLYGNRSLCYMKIGDLERAERDCSNAIELDPFYKRIYRRRAAVRLRRKDYYGSVLDIQSLRILSYNSQIDSTVLEEYKILLPLARSVKMEGSSSIRVKELETVVLSQLCKIEEAAAKSFKERAMWSDAVESLSMAIVVSPSTSRLYYERAFANYKLGKVLIAESDCSEAIELDPSNYKPYQLRAEIRKKLGNRKGSESDDKKARELFPTGNPGSSFEEPPCKSPKLSRPIASSPARPKPPPDEPHHYVRISVQDVYTSNSDQLYDLSKLPDKIRFCIFSQSDISM